MAVLLLLRFAAADSLIWKQAATAPIAAAPALPALTQESEVAA
jgi:hypothetical protein